ncbi:electron transport complex subunit RsxC [Candidatus Soleaferrea massiliensis]|uniref:electron transport complex subunit RsxC n=1 Tax=Candidatus Soleaferrea massiliensis TaxID=1470354 RepID=UPI0006934642|nr:electron transport complex subunit RsxC [Candidatus Soleaferrea massiliensis]
MAYFKKKHLSGVHVVHHKETAELESVVMPTPARVVLPLIQHMGSPCDALVKKGDTVKVGQRIADTDKFLSVPIHASVSGTVSGVEDFVASNGTKTKAIVIDADGEQTVDESIKPPVIGSREDFLHAVRASGLTGLGGAGFPTFIKLSPKNPDEVDTLVINSAECEPYITSDYRECMENSGDVLDGIRAVQKYLGIHKVIIAIENNKPKAIELFKKQTNDDSEITVHTLSSKYPQGAEKVIIYETTGRVVPEGKLPADVGVIVMNVSTISFIGKYLKTGMPLITKKITVAGSAIKDPKNIIAAIGTPIKDLVEFCGGYNGECAKILMGGPMMGIAVTDDDQPLIKNNNAILALDKAHTDPPKTTACIRCGRCVRACPFSLMPAAIERAFDMQDVESLQKLKVMNCMECGCCSFSCPAKRDLVGVNRLSKKMVRAAKR